MKAIIFFGIVLMVFSCKPKKEEVLTMEDIMPQSKNEKPFTPKDNKPTLNYGFDVKIADKIGIQVMEIDSIEDPMFPDRFSPRSTIKLTLHLKDNPIIYCQWAFKDSIQTKNAFYNWIDCFGPKCKSIKLGQKVNFQKDNFVMFVNDTSITYVSSPRKLTAEDWMKYFELKNEIEDWKILIQQNTSSKAKWFMVVEGKKEELILKQ